MLREAFGESADVVGHGHGRDQHVVHRSVVRVDHPTRVLPRDGLRDQPLPGLTADTQRVLSDDAACIRVVGRDCRIGGADHVGVDEPVRGQLAQAAANAGREFGGRLAGEGQPKNLVWVARGHWPPTTRRGRPWSLSCQSPHLRQRGTTYAVDSMTAACSSVGGFWPSARSDLGRRVAHRHAVTCRPSSLHRARRAHRTRPAHVVVDRREHVARHARADRSTISSAQLRVCRCRTTGLAAASCSALRCSLPSCTSSAPPGRACTAGDVGERPVPRRRAGTRRAARACRSSSFFGWPFPVFRSTTNNRPSASRSRRSTWPFSTARPMVTSKSCSAATKTRVFVRSHSASFRTISAARSRCLDGEPAGAQVDPLDRAGKSLLQLRGYLVARHTLVGDLLGERMHERADALRRRIATRAARRLEQPTQRTTGKGFEAGRRQPHEFAIVDESAVVGQRREPVPVARIGTWHPRRRQSRELRSRGRCASSGCSIGCSGLGLVTTARSSATTDGRSSPRGTRVSGRSSRSLGTSSSRKRDGCWSSLRTAVASRCRRARVTAT